MGSNDLSAEKTIYAILLWKFAANIENETFFAAL